MQIIVVRIVGGAHILTFVMLIERGEGQRWAFKELKRPVLHYVTEVFIALVVAPKHLCLIEEGTINTSVRTVLTLESTTYKDFLPLFVTGRFLFSK